jgi:hypothetical protein
MHTRNMCTRACTHARAHMHVCMHVCVMHARTHNAHMYFPFRPCPRAPFLSFLPLCLSPLLLSSSGMFYACNVLHSHMCMHAALRAHTYTHGIVLCNAVYICSGGRGAMRCCICVMLCAFTTSTSDMCQAARCPWALCCAMQCLHLHKLCAQCALQRVAMPKFHQGPTSAVPLHCIMRCNTAL